MEEANTRQRLDNELWKAKFPSCTVTHPPIHASDHLPIFLQIITCNQMKPCGPCGFKFEEAWLLWDDCEEVIKEAWSSSSVVNLDLGVVYRKIQGCGLDLSAYGLLCCWLFLAK